MWVRHVKHVRRWSIVGSIDWANIVHKSPSPHIIRAIVHVVWTATQISAGLRSVKGWHFAIYARGQHDVFDMVSSADRGVPPAKRSSFDEILPDIVPQLISARELLDEVLDRVLPKPKVVRAGH